MRIVMTLCTKDEEDIVDAHLAFHLNIGVDLVIVTDTGSSDGTVAILERYRDAGLVELRHDHSRPFDQATLVTAMARSAAAEHGADWVINSDADEFWWPRGPSLGEVFAAVPARYGVVSAIWRPFPPRQGAGEPFYESMTTRLVSIAPINDPSSPWRPGAKVAHRADPDVRVATGNVGVVGGSFRPLRGWYPIELFHFPMRSSQQVLRKHEANIEAWGLERHAYARRSHLARQRGEEPDPVSELAIEEQLEQGVYDGVLVSDTRLRDALRALRDPATGALRPPGPGEPRLALERPSLVDDALFAIDVSALEEANAVRLRRDLDETAGRLSALDELLLVRLERGLRGVLRAGRRRRTER